MPLAASPGPPGSLGDLASFINLIKSSSLQQNKTLPDPSKLLQCSGWDSPSNSSMCWGLGVGWELLSLRTVFLTCSSLLSFPGPLVHWVSEVRVAGLCHHTEDERRMGHLPRRAPPPATTPSTLTPHSRTGASRVLLPPDHACSFTSTPQSPRTRAAPQVLLMRPWLPGLCTGCSLSREFHSTSSPHGGIPAHSLRPRCRWRAGRELTY